MFPLRSYTQLKFAKNQEISNDTSLSFLNENPEIILLVCIERSTL